jgi:hypothetical protein
MTKLFQFLYLTGFAKQLIQYKQNMIQYLLGIRLIGCVSRLNTPLPIL